MPNKTDLKRTAKVKNLTQATSHKDSEIQQDAVSPSPESAEGKALLRVSALKKGELVDWVVVDPDEAVDMKMVRERIQKRGYKVSN